MKKQILTISVVIALMFLATLPTTSSYANDTGKVFSDGYVELTLNEMERTDTPLYHDTPLLYHHGCFRGPTDFVVINLTLTRIEGRYNVLPSLSDTLLFDDNGDNYTCACIFGGVIFKNETWHIAPAEEGSSWILYSDMPKNRKPVRLRFVYIFTESLLEYPFRENVSVNLGQIEIDLSPTPTPIPTLTPTSSPKPTPTVTHVPPTPTQMPALSPTAKVTEIPATKEKEVQGFEVIFAIAGLLAVAYLLRRRE